MVKATLTIMAAVAQLERDTMIERTRRAGRSSANGRTGGRHRKVDEAGAAKAGSDRLITTMHRYDHRDLARQLCERVGWTNLRPSKFL